MCQTCDERAAAAATRTVGRREILTAGLAAAPVLAAGAASAQTRPSAPPAVSLAATRSRAYAASSADSRFGPITIDRRAVGAKDVGIEVLYCGVCHSDIHAKRSDWGASTYPLVPGHEIVGRVTTVGAQVTKFRVGDIAGVGCMVDSCGTCEQCLNDRQQSCVNGTTFTYDSPDKASGGRTFGGYSEGIVVTEAFAIRIPPGANLAGTAPILCAGVTTFSPMQHWELRHGQKVGIIGLGGLGHMAVKLAVARGADVTVFTSSPGKVADAQRLGARAAVLWSDADAMEAQASQFDLLIATIPERYRVQPFLDVLKVDGTLVNVGALGDLEGPNGMALSFGRKSFAGSMIGGIAETQEVVDYCAARNITADIELIRPDQIDQAYARIMAKDIRYRFVIDMTVGQG